jgi:hypothetical protein
MIRLTSSFIVAFVVITSLQAQDRRAGTAAPAGAERGVGSVAAGMYSQLMHVRFTSPVTTPAQPPGGDIEVRARLENPVLATVKGSTQKTVVIPAGVDVNIQISLKPCCNAQPINSRMYLQIMSANVDPAVGRQRFPSGQVSHDFIGWPKPDEVIIPQNTTMSFPLLSDVPPDPSTTVDSVGSRPILPGSAFRVALVDEPIDVNNAGANKLFRGQLTEDMEFFNGRPSLPVDAIKLPKGTEVYVRSYEPDPEAQLGHAANWTVDYVVMNGKRIPVRTVVIRIPFQPGAQAISQDGKRKIPVVLWPVGQPRRYVLFEQQEVADNGSTLWTYPENPKKPEEYRLTPGSPPAVVPQGTPPSPPLPNRPNTTSADEARKRTEALRACQQRAITEHPGGGVELAQALAACSQAK